MFFITKTYVNWTLSWNRTDLLLFFGDRVDLLKYKRNGSYKQPIIVNHREREINSEHHIEYFASINTSVGGNVHNKINGEHKRKLKNKMKRQRTNQYEAEDKYFNCQVAKSATPPHRMLCFSSINDKLALQINRLSIHENLSWCQIEH